MLPSVSRSFRGGIKGLFSDHGLPPAECEQFEWVGDAHIRGCQTRRTLFAHIHAYWLFRGKGGGGKRRRADVDVDLTSEDSNDDPHKNPYAFLHHTSTAKNFEAFVANDIRHAGWGEHVESSAQEASVKLLTGENCNTACPNHFAPALAIAAHAEGLFLPGVDLCIATTSILNADLTDTRNGVMHHSNYYPISDR
jgi:hypothetical protein